ncbi:uncharacterized protein LOC133790556 isoform X2 [Humulus lupulus]|uniref:uncharacterized protein LOC133790556 isoform X2 n=1 Tax=Humulus lupulus TaxID=3486 RepID=UPI002B40CC7F|nr:uncharacterized protein LOC133790556 isoform X2 [Humulus lupulus]
MSCPSNGIVFNGSQCRCPVGNLLNRTTNRCVLFSAHSTITTDQGVDYHALTFPGITNEIETIRTLLQSQALFLYTTLVMVLSWFALCLFLRLMNPGNDGKSIWFKLRWWVSRLDISFATSHWLDDQKVVKKRKTELGGTFSIASWTIFIGLFAALLFEIISRNTIEVHSVRATNRPDLASFVNDMEFNITTLSSMSCSNLRDLGTLVTGNPGSIDYKSVPLSNFGNYSCKNTSEGPTVILKCDGCQPISDNLYISWHFVDLPNNPATAVGFQFNLTTRSHANKRHVSFVSGIVKNGSTFNDRPVTFRGRDTNILKFSLFPKIYHNLEDLRLIQPLFHAFVPGSHFTDTNQLQTSLASSSDGTLNTTLYINFLSSYIVEIDDLRATGLVSFLANLGGLYCISIGIFFFLLVQFECRIKKLRHEDSTLRMIRNRKKTLERWEKLRKYVMYTWGFSILDDDHDNKKNGSCCSGDMLKSISGKGSSQKHRQQSRTDSKIPAPNHSHTSRTKSLIPGTALSLEEKSDSRGEHKHEEEQQSSGSCKESSSQLVSFSLSHANIPLPPTLDLKDSSEMDMSDVQKNLKCLYEYNVMLREKFLSVQSTLHELATKSLPHANDDIPNTS